MPNGIEFVKFHVTGSGATGGNKVGGAAATVTGYISAAAGTVFNVVVGANPTGINANGNQSLISQGGSNLAVSNGGRTSTGNIPLHGEGTINTGNQYVVTGHVLTGGYGGIVNVDENVIVRCRSFISGVQLQLQVLVAVVKMEMVLQYIVQVLVWLNLSGHS
jgi:hypothetical protein